MTDNRGEGVHRLDLYALVMRLRDGGCLVSSSACSTAEISLARADRRLFVDDDGFGYVYLYRRPSRLDGL